ncbi:gluconokinase [Nocardia sp. NPDC057353]|uniref:gluconokinase n=1 Tax=Nocardia sp. NPDC057353 TaxID=3346104 RepID=UPI00362EEA6D
MGVSGSGKTTVGELLAARLGVPFTEGDELHPAANVATMRAGTPLTDADRWPWLDIAGARLAAVGGVLSCSALARRYRDRLRALVPGVCFAHLDVPRAELERRLAARRGHFMPASLLASQLAALEPLRPDERGWTVPAAGAPDELAAHIADLLIRPAPGEHRPV